MQRLGMPNKHVSTGGEVIRKFVQDALLRWSVKVDDDIAAKNRIGLFVSLRNRRP